MLPSRSKSAHDHAGNTRTVLTSSSTGTRYTHDAWNRLVKVETVAAGPAIATVARYEYNGLHWRTLRDNAVDERDLFYYSSDWQLLEEHRIAHEGNPAHGDLVRVAQQFWGIRYIDDAIARRIDGNADGDYSDGEDGTWFYVTDVQFSVVALLTDTAELAERVAYDAYGRARHRWFTDLDGDGDADNNDFFAQLAAQSTSIHADAEYRPDADHDRNGVINNDDFFAFLAGAGQAALPYGLISDPLGPDNPIGYDGYVFAPEAGLNVPTGSPQPQAIGAYAVRFRWYLPETGRWLQKDPAGYIDGMGLYQYLSSQPSGSDPSGLCGPPEEDLVYRRRDGSARTGHIRGRDGGIIGYVPPPPPPPLTCDQIESELEYLIGHASYLSHEAMFYQNEVLAYESDPWFVAGGILRDFGDELLSVSLRASALGDVWKWRRVQRVAVRGGRLHMGNGPGGGFRRLQPGESPWSFVYPDAIGVAAFKLWASCHRALSDAASDLLGVPLTASQALDHEMMAMLESVLFDYRRSVALAEFYSAQHREASRRIAELIDLRDAMQCDSSCGSPEASSIPN